MFDGMVLAALPALAAQALRSTGIWGQHRHDMVLLAKLLKQGLDPCMLPLPEDQALAWHSHQVPCKPAPALQVGRLICMDGLQSGVVWERAHNPGCLIYTTEHVPSGHVNSE